MQIKYRRNPIKNTHTKVEVKAEINNQPYKRIQKELTFKRKKGTFTTIILRKNGSALICYVPIKSKSFSIEGNTYFNVKSGCYIVPGKNILTIYLEGCVMPIEHRYIVYEKHHVLLTDRTGVPVKDITENIPRDELNNLPKDNKGNFIKTEDGFIIKRILDRIKGLEFDSVIANAIYNSGLIEKVSKGGRPDKFLFMIFLLLVINLVVSSIAIITQFIK